MPGTFACAASQPLKRPIAGDGRPKRRGHCFFAKITWLRQPAGARETSLALLTRFMLTLIKG